MAQRTYGALQTAMQDNTPKPRLPQLPKKKGQKLRDAMVRGKATRKAW